MSIKNVKIRFNLDKENDRKAYEYLCNAEKSYSKAVISAICGYMTLSERTANEDAFLERIIYTQNACVLHRNKQGLCVPKFQSKAADFLAALLFGAYRPKPRKNEWKKE